MTLADEIKVLDDRIKTNKAQYNLDREAAKIYLHCHPKDWINMNTCLRKM